MVLFFTHIVFVVNHTFNATPLERLQQYYSHSLLLNLHWDQLVLYLIGSSFNNQHA